MGIWAGRLLETVATLVIWLASLGDSQLVGLKKEIERERDFFYIVAIINYACSIKCYTGANRVRGLAEGPNSGCVTEPVHNI